MSIAAKAVKVKKPAKKLKVEKQIKKDEEEKEEEMSDSPTSDTGDVADAESDVGNSSDEDQSMNGDDTESKFAGNPGWADAMLKILKTNKPKKKKTLVLSRAKKISEVKAKPEVAPFQVEDKDGTVKEAVIEKPAAAPKVDEAERKKRKREKLKHHIRVKPSPLDMPREKVLQRIATRGVVQLFNAVKQQQEEIETKMSEAGPTEAKREKVLKSIDKRAFLDVLMGSTKSVEVDKAPLTTKKEEDEEKSSKVWSVLRDDFVMGANLKDWDKKAPEEDDEDSSGTEEMDSD